MNTRSRYYLDAGFAKIAAVQPEVIRTDWGEIVGEIVWLVDDQGNVWARDLLIGETLDQVAAHYRKRGFTDVDCTFFKAKETA